MPPLELRGRYLMREYWADSDLHLRLTAEVRELYQGLWMLADDEGILPRDVPAISAALYRYEDRAPREKRVRAGLDRLRELGKVHSFRCGCLEVPAVVRYPRPGKKSLDHSKVHQTHSNLFEENLKPHSNGTKTVQTHSNRATLPVPSLPDPTARDDFKSKMAAKGARVPS